VSAASAALILLLWLANQDITKRALAAWNRRRGAR
jgi:hypothetical protein